ncbi:LptF/LptG family permease [Roseospira marina]|uniref:LptF/LptG family permease n=1 Tax=Roseospira marina TaxID=140057 RepID=UPI00147853E3|nr:LptF/LptG family permease [Roseospira marina]MBB4315858.1 lipopolysaccharide export system permease protein [Roseospira marina]MBB5089002.1 lipopolysaccharide export system permease protein [Roseospira marina]
MRLIDRYILLQVMPPLGVSLAVLLVGLVLERILRLFNIIAQQGQPFGSILAMALNLVPHYLGLALPAAFFISLFLVAARFSEENELDAIRSCGLSIRRFSRPLIGLGLVLAVVAFALYGYLQPYSRYAYRAILHTVTSAPWDASVVAGTFVDPGDGYTIYADRMDDGGAGLENVFVHERRKDGATITTTAARGLMRLSDDHRWLRVVLEDAVQIRDTGIATPTVVAFDRLTLTRPFTLAEPRFRRRGKGERELTLTELRAELDDPWSTIPDDALRAEFHSRLVRSVSLLVLPMLAIPMGLAAKRTFRWQGIALAAVILLLYHHTLQFGASLAALGRVDPRLSLWGPFVVFTIACAVLFLTLERRAGVLPFDALFTRLDAVTRGIAGWARRRMPDRKAPR